MASIRREIVIDAGLEPAWDALRRVGDAHRLFAPVLTAPQIDGDIRTVHFANGMVVRGRSSTSTTRVGASLTPPSTPPG